MKRISIVALALIIASCGPADNEPGPGGVTVGEARALDEAAEMIEAKRLPPQEQSDAGTSAEQPVEDTNEPSE